MRIKSASKTAFVLVIICLLMSLGKGAYGIVNRIQLIDRGMDSIFLLMSILYMVAGVVQVVALLVVFYARESALQLSRRLTERRFDTSIA